MLTPRMESEVSEEAFRRRLRRLRMAFAAFRAGFVAKVSFLARKTPFWRVLREKRAFWRVFGLFDEN